ncbi:MAG: hypothetical protein E7399_04865 [Ruminococcaceae bacterium]|nr:hypothetical protein [Oscillospiraceae bacterium]
MDEIVRKVKNMLYVLGGMLIVLGMILWNQYGVAKKADFTDNHIALIVPQTPYYHTYDCVEFDRSHFIAYNIKSAENRGYRPCPICHITETMN